jgi:pimeloyl-ACP methyl ester carboxylesterase
MQRAILAILVSFAANAFAQSFQTTVQPQPKEDLAQSCHYELTLAAGKQKVHGVWVVYDRGPQITSFYSDPDVTALAKRNRLALLLAHQCNSINAPGGPDEMDMDPSHGIGRALFTALDQFAQQSKHPELSSSKLVLLGFSGTGALFAHFEEYAPNRVIAAVLVHPAHYEPMALDSVELTRDGLMVPELIFAGGADKIATTQAPYEYFLRYRQKGAPWTFVVQNNADHFRVNPTKPLILGWLDEVLILRKPQMNKPLRAIDTKGPWTAYLARCSSNEEVTPTWNVCRATVEKAPSPTIANMLPAGWLPSKQVAELWLQTAKQDESEASRH